MKRTKCKVQGMDGIFNIETKVDSPEGRFYAVRDVVTDELYYSIPQERILPYEKN